MPSWAYSRINRTTFLLFVCGLLTVARKTYVYSLLHGQESHLSVTLSLWCNVFLLAVESCFIQFFIQIFQLTTFVFYQFVTTFATIFGHFFYQINFIIVFILHISAALNKSLPAAHHGEVCEDLSSYRVNLSTRLYFTEVWYYFDSIRLFSHFLFILRLQFSTRGLALFSCLIQTLIRQYSTF